MKKSVFKVYQTRTRKIIKWESLRFLSKPQAMWKWLVLRLKNIRMNLYFLQVNVRRHTWQNRKNWNIWHQRLGHCSQGMIRASLAHISVVDVHEFREHDDTLEPCITRGSTPVLRRLVSHDTERAVTAIVRVYTDVIGPVEEDSIKIPGSL